ncbi:MAG: hypothetical protein ACYC9X_00675 [Dehalococcoidia bacterium]
MAESTAAPATTTAAAPAAEGRPEAAAPAEDGAAKRKFKIDGADIELSDAEVTERVQKSGAADKRLQEAAAARKAVEGERAAVDAERGKLVKALKDGDYDALKSAGLSDDEIEAASIQYLTKRQQEELENERRKSLDPKVRAQEDAVRERDELKKKLAEREQEDAKRSEATTERAWIRATDEVLAEFPEDIRGHWLVRQRAAEALKYAFDHPDVIAEVEKRENAALAKAGKPGDFNFGKDGAKYLARMIERDIDGHLSSWAKRKAATPAAPAGPAAPGAQGAPVVVREKGERKKDEKSKGRSEAEILRALSQPT